MLTRCTNPDATLYTVTGEASYQADLIILRFLERNGVDIPCNVLSGLTAGILVGLAAIFFFAAYSVLASTLK